MHTERLERLETFHATVGGIRAEPAHVVMDYTHEGEAGICGRTGPNGEAEWGQTHFHLARDCPRQLYVGVNVAPDKTGQPEPRDISWGISSVGNTELPQFRLTRFCPVQVL